MKIIDLLLKIANGEEVPKIIKYDSFTYWYDESEKDYYRMIAKDLDDEDVEYLLDSCFASDILNDKIEIIEEDKPIKKLEKIPTSAYHFGKGITYCNFTNEQNINVIYLRDKINELIDVVNELKSTMNK